MTGKKKGLRALIAGDRLELLRFGVIIALSLVLFAAAIWYIVACVSIYSDGGSTPFTREIVAEQLRKLLPISIIAIVLTVAAGVISLFAAEPKPTMIKIKSKALVRITEKKLSSEHLSSDYLDTRATEASFRAKIMTAIGAASSVIAAVALIIIIDPSRYTVSDVNTDIAYSSVIAAVSTILVFAGVYTASLLNELSYKRVLEAAREELSRQRENGITVTPCEDTALGEGHTLLLVRLVIIAVAVTLIILGIFNDGMADVLGKAVRICTECIGLG